MTDASIATCLWFEKDAEAAARHYTGLVPDGRITGIFHQNGDPSLPAFLVEFSLQGQKFQAMNGGPHYRLTPATSVVIHVDTQAELDRLWSALLAGGTESRCGWLTDRWGLSWQIIPRALPRLLKSPGAAGVLQALGGMVKLDIAALEAAARG